MSDNVTRLKRQSNHGLTQVESIEDAFLALFEMEGECDQLLIELSEAKKLNDDRLNVFAEIWEERLTIMRDRARACQQALQSPRPALAVVNAHAAAVTQSPV
jgi:hypothetical protein